MQNSSDVEQPTPEQKKFRWFGLREKLRIFRQMYQFHSTWDAEQALRSTLWKGIQSGRKEANKKPYCDLHNNPEFDPPLVFIGGGLFGCPQCRQISEPMLPVRRPTIRLVESQAERPYHKRMGPDTSLHVAINMLKEGQTGVMRKISRMQAEDVPTQVLNRKEKDIC